ncbi:hypothetical protein [Micromonospora aurantiaca (nom. illeg.)]|uniref:hypothetical protein n=1 Tax=Micromonospora aurantiaca (nom. illeg.) TaxID=47850 RepID=UPI0033CBB579
MAEQRYTLAQIARRVRLTEGRIRAMYGQGRLPHPDGSDPDGKPYWLESTVDGWIRSTGRPLPDGAAWPWTWPAATAPAREVAREDVLVNAHGDPAPATVIVWDTGHGHVAYVMRHRADTMLLPAALTAAVVLHPAHWGPAVVLVPDHHLLGRAEEHVSIDAYRLLTPHRDIPAQTRRLPRFLAAFLGESDDDTVAEDDHEPVDVSRVRIKHIGIPHADAIAEVLGRPLPLWIDHTCAPDTARAAAAYGDTGTLTVPDTTTDWPATRDRLAAAVAAGLHTRHPQAFITLARSVIRDVRFIERQHEQTRERGPGWYLAARPARPQWDVALEHLTTTAATHDVDPDDAAAELSALRAEEADLPWDSPAAPAMFEAAGHLAVRLHTTHPETVFDDTVRHVVETTGPVTDQYIAGLTRLDDTTTRHMLTRPTRRLARLLIREAVLDPSDRNLLDRAAERLTGLYRNRDGRLVAAFTPARGHDHPTYAIEWPTGLPTGWTDATVIAADPSPSGALVVALTPTPDGELRTDLLPNPGDEPGYGWGYNGGSPWRLYQALTRCALDTWLTPSSDDPDWMMHLNSTPADSPLYHHLVTHHGPLRLPWPQIQQWAHLDDHQTPLAHTTD